MSKKTWNIPVWIIVVISVIMIIGIKLHSDLRNDYISYIHSTDAKYHIYEEIQDRVDYTLVNYSMFSDNEMLLYQNELHDLMDKTDIYIEDDVVLIELKKNVSSSISALTREEIADANKLLSLNRKLLFEQLFSENVKYIEQNSLSMLMDNVSVSELATLLGVIATFFVIVLTRVQINKTTEISRAEFWLEIDKMFIDYDDIHFKLRDGGKWHCVDQEGIKVNYDEMSCKQIKENSKCKKCVIEHDEWSKIVSYLGLFEHCELMIQDGIIDQRRFEVVFSYRIKNLIRNKQIRCKLIEEKDEWVEFNNLLKRFNLIIN